MPQRRAVVTLGSAHAAFGGDAANVRLHRVLGQGQSMGGRVVAAAESRAFQHFDLTCLTRDLKQTIA